MYAIKKIRQKYVALVSNDKNEKYSTKRIILSENFFSQ